MAKPEEDGILLAVRVTTRAETDAVVGWRSNNKDELSVRVTVAPEDGKANAALIRVLSQSFEIPKSDIRLIRGHTARQKLLVVALEKERFEHWKDSLPTLG